MPGSQATKRTGDPSEPASAVLAYVANPVWMAWSKAGLPVGLRWLGVATGASVLVSLWWLFSLPVAPTLR